MSSLPEARAQSPAVLSVVALAGNPNSGKTSVFNCLTGLRRKVGNYPGVTVESVSGELRLPEGRVARLIDLPGCYSLHATSEDERIARDVLLGRESGSPRPDAIIAVVDASNLERNLFLATQLFETGLPVVIALNMVDVAERSGVPVDAAALERALGVPVVPVVGRDGTNIEALPEALGRARRAARVWRMTREAEDALEGVREVVAAAKLVPEAAAEGEALRLLAYAEADDPGFETGGSVLRDAVALGRARLEQAGIDREAVEAECRYAACNDFARSARKLNPDPGPSRSERVDRVLTHRVLGPIIYVALMAIIFEAVYTWAEPFMGWIEGLTAWAGETAARALPPGALTDLLVDGIIAGVGNVLVFLPQICLLFLFLTLLEDLGYLARAAFIVDRPMRTVGLHGKAFIPLMSSFACAIPGIMATRTIESRRDRLVTILVAPLMSCSARLPIYALMIGAFVPAGYQGLTLLAMYLLSVLAALGAAWALRKTLFRGESSTFILELPSYKLPVPGHVIRKVLGRGWVFVKQAGTVILALSVVLWFLAYYPRSAEVKSEAERRIEAGEDPGQVANRARAEQVAQSYAGRLGHLIEPAIEPLGFDWKIGVGLLSSFAAREVLVSSLGIVYSVGDADEGSVALRQRLHEAAWPDGRKVFSLLTALSLMVFFVLACQCMSTLAVVKRETNSWRWPLFMFAYMTTLAYVGSLVVYQGGMLLGVGG